MPDLILRYFDFNGGRGEVARISMSLGGIPFEDDRIPVADWSAHKERAPFHALPVLEIDGQIITQCNAINRYVGKLAHLYPEDAVEAARCDEVMDAVEDVVTRVVATFGISDTAELRAAREAMLVARGGEFFADGRLTVADLKVFVWIRNLRSGVLDHVPPDLTDRVAPKLVEHHDRVASQPGIVTYYEKLSSP
jgi:glutathione S-transferase